MSMMTQKTTAIGSSSACTEAPEKVRKARTTATSTNQTRESGMRTFQPSFMKWS